MRVRPTGPARGGLLHTSLRGSLLVGWDPAVVVTGGLRLKQPVFATTTQRHRNARDRSLAHHLKRPPKESRMATVHESSTELRTLRALSSGSVIEPRDASYDEARMA